MAQLVEAWSLGFQTQCPRFKSTWCHKKMGVVSGRASNLNSNKPQYGHPDTILGPPSP